MSSPTSQGSRQLYITVAEAQLVRIFDSLRPAQDVFVQLVCGYDDGTEKVVGKTEVCKNGNFFPRWNEQFRTTRGRGKTLKFKVFVDHLWRNAVLCGEAEFDLDNLWSRQLPGVQKVPVALYKKNEQTGVLTLALEFIEGSSGGMDVTPAAAGLGLMPQGSSNGHHAFAGAGYGGMHGGGMGGGMGGVDAASGGLMRPGSGGGMPPGGPERFAVGGPPPHMAAEHGARVEAAGGPMDMAGYGARPAGYGGACGSNASPERGQQQLPQQQPQAAAAGQAAPVGYRMGMAGLMGGGAGQPAPDRFAQQQQQQPQPQQLAAAPGARRPAAPAPACSHEQARYAAAGDPRLQEGGGFGEQRGQYGAPWPGGHQRPVVAAAPHQGGRPLGDGPMLRPQVAGGPDRFAPQRMGAIGEDSPMVHHQQQQQQQQQHAMMPAAGRQPVSNYTDSQSYGVGGGGSSQGSSRLPGASAVSSAAGQDPRAHSGVGSLTTQGGTGPTSISSKAPPQSGVSDGGSMYATGASGQWWNSFIDRG
eukprot:TRINITY_DN2900_c0_g1_i1.p1 TRINITY_DN2900_c0_g1~~TRINITY_DN2900_c0_g1_i1.p1  ORF type:complete len:529 (-),score=136.29 TRINITY_DN2900_c0_g1_i1:114-1700(-)